MQSGQLSAGEAEALAWGWQARGVDLSVLAAGLSVALAGGDVDVGAGAAEHAVRNNALCFGVCVGVGGALAVMGASWTAYDVSKTYREEGGEAALRQLARDGAIVVVTSGAGVITYKVGNAVFRSGPEAWQAVKERSIWNNTGKIANSGSKQRTKNLNQIRKLKDHIHNSRRMQKRVK